jgi:hypothetical protein
VRLFGYQEVQTVFYLLSRFQAISQRTRTPSQFTAERVQAHFVPQAHVRPAFAFARRVPLDPVSNARGLPGWDADDGRKRFLDGCFVMRSATRRAEVDDAGDGDDADALAAVRAARRDAAAAGLPDDGVDEAILRSVRAAGPGTYQALWGKPVVDVMHDAVGDWLENRDFLDYRADLNRTFPFCSLCNNIWDCWARQSQVYRSPTFMPRQCVYVKNGRNTIRRLPLGGDQQLRDHQVRLGCLAAYYLHGSLLRVWCMVTDEAKFGPAKRDAVLALLWIPLHAHCMYQEMGRLASGGEHQKGRHNYLGCLDLLVSQFVYTMACVDPAEGFAGFPFLRFHVLYMKELGECPPPAWDPSAHRRVHDFVFDAAYRGLGSVEAQVSRASERLVELYEGVVKPLLPFLRGAGPAPDPSAERFFATAGEADALAEGFLELAARDPDNLRLCLERAGCGAVLWQLQRALRDEHEDYQREVSQWLLRRMQAEWRNIALNADPAGRVSVREGQLLYLLAHTREPSAALPPPGAAPSQQALDVARDGADDPVPVLGAMRDAGRCSMWKAAARLRAWHFTRERRPDPVLLDGDLEDDSASEGEEDAAFYRAPRRGARRRQARLGAAAGDRAGGVDRSSGGDLASDLADALAAMSLRRAR